MRIFENKEVNFFCADEDYGVIPEPYPARKFLPEWYKKLPQKINKENKLENSTIKRCAPFQDAMNAGWIIPLAADVEIITNSDASGVTYKSMFHKNIIENHNEKQLNPPDGPSHPMVPKPPMKFLNYWYIKIPRGYSALFVSPLNRADPRFSCMAGLVDDGYMGTEALEYINFPFSFNIPNYTGIIKAGTPLVQMILLKRDNVLKSSRKSNIRKITSKEILQVEWTRAKRRSHESYYRDSLRDIEK